ncbi:superoxide dismutase [Streptomyces sp. NBC_00490]|uniref:SMP-30/gluconolactonase/LRE family protein n=1 Tax=Streptomyces sp. NBC_00490 TaxID=2903657 RepID=UPI002E19F210
MSRTMPRRTFLTSAAALTATAALPATPAAAAPRITTAFELPGDRVYPEGIAVDPRKDDVYVGSYGTGTVYRATPGRRRAEVFLPAGADGRTTANGIKADRAGRLWVTDSTAGVDVYDIRDRALLARFAPPGDAPFLINDLVITPDGTAYVTDSLRPLVYRVTPADLDRARGGRATLSPYADVSGVGVPREAYTLNGIATDGRHLFVVDMVVGDLFRLDLATGAVRQVALRGGDMAHGDGLELVRGTLWVAHNASNTISRWRLGRGAGSARLERRFSDPALQIPTTLVHSRGQLLVVRAQFDKGGPFGPGVPQTPFTVARVDGI